MNELTERFKAALINEGLSAENTSVLLCVSGGLDSIVMTHLFVLAGYQVTIAHVNYGLRGSESDADALFVQNMAAKYNIGYSELNAKSMMQEPMVGKSVQMKAREIRYRWFHELLSLKKLNFAATAHHTDDELETFLMNVHRGAGGKGASGYEYRRGHYIKPLIGFSRVEIQRYAEEHGLTWREDSSNKKELYLRNRIRKNILPEINRVLPGFSLKLHETFTRLKRERKLLEKFISEKKSLLLIPTDHGFEISATELMLLPDPPLILFEFIGDFGFGMDDCESICQNLTTEAGKRFFSDTWQIRIERDRIFIYNVLCLKDSVPPVLVFEENAVLPDSTMKIAHNEAFLNMEKLSGHLHLRIWQNGDYFYPTGMNGKKLLSDFLREKRLPFTLRKQQYVLMHNEDIVWVVNHRIDKRFAADKLTKNILKVSVESS